MSIKTKLRVYCASMYGRDGDTTVNYLEELCHALVKVVVSKVQQ
jgi:hypothetical protein